MKVIIIDWKKQLIEEHETDSIRYDEDGISYTSWSGNLLTTKKVPYKNFLGVKK